MKNSEYPFDRYSYSIDTKEAPKIIWQQAQSIHQHQVPQGYLILAKNDFGKVKKRVNVGYFNKKTNFIIGEKNSLVFWDNHQKKIAYPDTSEALKEPQRYFIIYDLNFIADEDLQNHTLEIINKKNSEKISISLTKQFGKDIGQLLAKSDPSTTQIPQEYEIIKAIIAIEDGRLSINKQVLINSNTDFLLGILEGYIQDKRHFILKNNINIYNFTYIMNLLGAQYSVRSIQNNEKHIRFKLPFFLKQKCNLKENFFREVKYYFNEENVLTLSKILPTNPEQDTTLFSITNLGLIEMIPLKDLVFIEIKDQTMYDLTMTNADATNFSLPCMPYSKNSDGDILGIIAMHSKDASQECIRKFSTELKENFLSLSDASVNNWGVKLDSQVGLYSATK